MDEHSTGALGYGHLGTALYVPQTQSWTFSRSLTRPPPVSYAGATKLAVRSPITAPQLLPTNDKDVLRRTHPELAASWAHIRNERLSYLISTTAEVCDPQVTSLFDIGNAVDFENDGSGARTIPISVVAGGECGNVLTFRRFEEETTELRHETTTWMRIPAITNTDSTEWSTGGAPVRQLCFARTVEEKSTWMLARFSHATTVFRPLFHRTPVPMQFPDDDRLIPANPRNSRLEANPLVEVSISQTGGFSHADSTFNPWYQRQFAIVDERGNWGIWEISGRQRRHKANWSAACIKSGALPWLDAGDNQDMDNQQRHDGWAAIEWAGDINGIIVSDRRCPMLYRTEDDQVRSHPIELNLKRKSEWILDVKRSSHNVSHVFILTTSRIFLVDVNPESVSTEQDKPSVYPRLSWRHFRDPEDTTLRLTSLLVGEEFYLILYSRLSQGLIAFQCPGASEGEDNTLSIPDPIIVDFPLFPDPHDDDDEPEDEIEFRFSTLVFKQVGHSLAPVGRENYDPNARVIKLFTLDSRFSLYETVYFGPPGDADMDQPRHLLQTRKRQKGVDRNRVEDDDFVVDDFDESIIGSGFLSVPDGGISTLTPLALPSWTVDFSKIYQVAAGKRYISARAKKHEKSFRECVKAIEKMISKLDLSKQATCKSMLDYLVHRPLLDDVDQNSRDLEAFISNVAAQAIESEEKYRLVILPARAEKLTDSTLDLVDTYDGLVTDWLSCLPHGIPGRTRIMKEKIIRGIAADIVLARINIVPRATEAKPDERDADSNAPGIPRSLSLPPIQSSQPEPGTPNPTSSEQPPPPPTYTTLSSLTKFKPKKSPSRTITNILSHWIPGTNPSTYDWTRTTLSLDVESRRSTTPATPKRRIRNKRSQSNVPDSSIPAVPTVSSSIPVRDAGWGSQPQLDNEPPRLRLQSSQGQIGDEDLPMTQVERGVFGGREVRKPVAKARKKKRAAGF